MELSIRSIEQQQNGQQGKKRTIYVRKKLQDHIQNSKNMASHPKLPNVKISNIIAPQKDQKNLQKQLSRNQTIQMKFQEQFSKDSIHTGGSKDDNSNMLNNLSNSDQQLQQDDFRESKYVGEVDGPQLKLSRTNISFVVLTGKVAYDYIEVENNGTASIYHEWMPIENQKVFNWTLDETEQKFYCHHEKNVIKPGEKKKFIFAFLSSMTGVFNQEWQLICEPPCFNEKISKIYISGQALKIDSLVDWRKNFENNMNYDFLYKNMNEIVEDIMVRVRTPTPELPDLTDEKVAEREFESKNREWHVWYNPLVIKWLKNLELELYSELKMDPEQQYWDLSLSYLKGLIDRISDYEERDVYEKIMENYVELCKKRPVERSPMWDYVHNIVDNWVDDVQDLSDNVRKELDMWESLPFQQPPLSEEQIAINTEDLGKIKQEWLKKAKKKKWGEEEEKAILEQHKKNLTEKLKNKIVNDLGDIHDQEKFQYTKKFINNWQHPDLKFFNDLQRIQTVEEQDIDGKRILIRNHLIEGNSIEQIQKKELFEQRILQEKADEEKRLEQERIEAEKVAKDRKKGKRQLPGPGSKKGAKKEEEKEEKKEEEIKLDFLDQDNLSSIMENIKFLQAKNCKLIFLCLSYGEKSGQYTYVNSMKFFANWLKKQFDNYQIFFEKNIIIDNFEEKMETEIYPDSSIIVLENSFFFPQEIGFENILKEQETENEEENKSPSNQQQQQVIQTQVSMTQKKQVLTQQQQLLQQQQKVLDKEKKEQISHCKLMFEDRLEYIRLLSEYGNIYVLEDKWAIYQEKLASVFNLKSDTKVLGVRIGQQVQTASHMMTFQKNPYLFIMGGEMDFDKLLVFYNAFFYASTLALVSEFGIQYYLWKNKKAYLGQVKANQQFQQILEIIDENILKEQQLYDDIVKKKRKPLFQRPQYPLIIYPQDFLFSGELTGELDSPEQRQFMIENRRNWNGKKFEKRENETDEIEVDDEEPSNCIILDIGEKTIKDLLEQIDLSNKITWLDNIALNYDIFQMSNQIIAKQLHQINIMKSQRVTDHKGNTEYSFSQDALIFVIGKQLISLIENYQIVEKKTKVQNKIKENDQSNDDNQNDDILISQNRSKKESVVSAALDEDEEDMNDVEDKSTHSGNQKQKKKNKNVELFSDYFIEDTNFTSKIISGQFFRALHNLDIYQEKNLDEGEIAVRYIDSVFDRPVSERFLLK